MSHMRRILCPVDFSDFSRRALDYAYGLARWSGAEVRVLYVDPLVIPPVVATGMGVPVPLDLSAPPQTQSQIADQLRAFAMPGAEGITSQSVGLVGDPVREIVKQATAAEADVLVVGTHGRGGFERWALGSTTAKLLRKSPCDVLVIPKLARGFVPEAQIPFKTIVCAVDFSETSRLALEHALALAEEGGGRVVPVHSVEDLAVPEGEESLAIDVRIGDFLRQRERDVQQRLQAIVPGAARDRIDPMVIARGRPAPAILKCAIDRDADLIVMGSHGRHGIAGFFVGSTTEHVVREAVCPVLTARASGRTRSGEEESTLATQAAGS